MTVCGAFTAVVNRKETPNKLYVVGGVWLYGMKNTVSLKEAVPQGIVPTQLLLELEVQEEGGPQKGVCTSASFEKTLADPEQYTSVLIRRGDEIVAKVDVQLQ